MSTPPEPSSVPPADPDATRYGPTPPVPDPLATRYSDDPFATRYTSDPAAALTPTQIPIPPPTPGAAAVNPWIRDPG